MLDIKHMSVSYGKHLALSDASLHVKQGEIVVILGANGAGKSSLLRATAGICDGTVSGSVSLNGRILDLSSPDKLVDDGLALVPEGRGIFGDLTVAEI
jgi:branched-chain amino acid transport system ATP-binding protein